MFKAATSTLSSRLNAKALQTGYKGEHTYKGELTKATYHTWPFFQKSEHTYKRDLAYTCELSYKGEPTLTGELKLKGDHTYKGDLA
jgi:hypothetical protein